MFLAISIIIMIAGYIFLETYFRRNNVTVTWYDRLLGGIGGIVLLTGLWLYLSSRGELKGWESYMLVILTMLSATTLGASAWLSITRRK